MRRILALAFAAMLLLSLNAAFSASWGDGSANPAAAAAMTIEVVKYVSQKDATGQTYFSRLDDAAILKAGDRVAFQVKITVPSVGSLNNQFKTTAFHAGDTLDVKISGTNLRYGHNLDFGIIQIGLTAEKQTVYLEKERTAGSAVSTVTDLTGANAGMYLDEAKETGALELRVNVRFYCQLSEIVIKAGDDRFKVAQTTTSLGTAYGGPVYAVTGESSFDGAAAFFVTEDGAQGKTQVKEIYVGVDGCVMKAVKIGGVYQCNTVAVSGTHTAAAKYAGDDFLNKILRILGFSAADALHSGSIYMDDLNWAQNFGVSFNSGNSAAYAAYTLAPVTIFTPAQTRVPKTGGGVSPAGLILVLLAAAAATAVGIRRIRA